MWIDPTDGDRFVVAHDDGLSFSVNRGRSWHQVQLPVAQMCHVATDNQIPYNVYGNRQDGPSTLGPSNSRLAKQYEDDPAVPIPRGLWHSVAGGESGWAIPDPVDSNIIWASGTGYGSLGGSVERYDERTRQAREVEIWPESTVARRPARSSTASTGRSPSRSRRTTTTRSTPARRTCIARPTAAGRGPSSARY